jgi:hypothetical protein
VCLGGFFAFAVVRSALSTAPTRVAVVEEADRRHDDDDAELQQTPPVDTTPASSVNVVTKHFRSMTSACMPGPAVTSFRSANTTMCCFDVVLATASGRLLLSMYPTDDDFRAVPVLSSWRVERLAGDCSAAIDDDPSPRSLRRRVDRPTSPPSSAVLRRAVVFAPEVLAAASLRSHAPDRLSDFRSAVESRSS